MTGLDLTSAVTGAVSTVTSQLTTIAPDAIGVGVGVFVLFFGWKIVKRLSK